MVAAVRVDFYLLAASTSSDRLHFACRLTDKAYQQKQQLLLWCADEKTAHTVDELLWTFADTSFIPHNLVGEGPNPPPPIQVGFGVTFPNHQRQTLINLTTDIISPEAPCRRIIEIVLSEPEATERSRDHFRHYRQRGAELYTHDLRKEVST